MPSTFDTALCSSLSAATADKVNNLYSVAFRQSSPLPLIASNDKLIQLNCDPRRCERQLVHEVAQHPTFQHLAALPIELNQQPCFLSSGGLGRQDDSPQLGGLAVDVSLDQHGCPAGFK